MLFFGFVTKNPSRLRNLKKCNEEYFAIECYKQTTDSKFFERLFKDHLLEVIPKDHTVIMDNAIFHRKKSLRKFGQKKGTIIYYFFRHINLTITP